MSELLLLNLQVRNVSSVHRDIALIIAVLCCYDTDEVESTWLDRHGARQ